MITALDIERSGDIVTAFATSDLAAPDVTVYYHWYLDGLWVGFTIAAERQFLIQRGQIVRLTVADSTDPDFDPFANPPDGYPARQSLFFIRSKAANITAYKLQEQKAGGAWADIGTLPAEAIRWSYLFTTPRLEDLTQYAFRVIALDNAATESTPLALPARQVVRTPDAPAFTVTVNDKQTVTINPYTGPT